MVKIQLLKISHINHSNVKPFATLHTSNTSTSIQFDTKTATLHPYSVSALMHSSTCVHTKQFPNCHLLPHSHSLNCSPILVHSLCWTSVSSIPVPISQYHIVVIRNSSNLPYEVLINGTLVSIVTSPCNLSDRWTTEPFTMASSKLLIVFTFKPSLSHRSLQEKGSTGAI